MLRYISLFAFFLASVLANQPVFQLSFGTPTPAAPVLSGGFDPSKSSLFMFSLEKV